MTAFDEHAEKYDSWFMQNRSVFGSELLLLRHFLRRPGEALSVGCGSGLFELALRQEHGIHIQQGIEPAVEMAEIARRRGLDVRVAPAEHIPFAEATFDTVLMNGIAAYVSSLAVPLREARRVLKPGGWLVMADVPASSGYGLLYQLAGQLGDWELPALKKVAPQHPYPVAFLKAAAWRTTEELTACLVEVGFCELEYAQTLTVHPRFSDAAVEEPTAGYQRGGYVAIRARRGAVAGKPS